MHIRILRSSFRFVPACFSRFIFPVLSDSCQQTARCRFGFSIEAQGQRRLIVRSVRLSLINGIILVNGIIRTIIDCYRSYFCLESRQSGERDNFAGPASYRETGSGQDESALGMLEICGGVNYDFTGLLL
jgi:hypothetical protein